MKTLLVLLALLIKVSLFSQSVPISQRFKNEEYRLFIHSPYSQDLFSLNRTDQIYTVDLLKDQDVYIIKNSALKFICDFKTGVAEMYFDGVLDGVYSIKFWDSYNFFVIQIPIAKTSYNFFRIYSPDKTW